LPQRIEAESADEIGSALETVPSRPGADDQAGSHVEPGRYTDAVARVDSRLLGEETVETELVLHRLRTSLPRACGRHHQYKERRQGRGR
jgi:hypothetical protein